MAGIRTIRRGPQPLHSQDAAEAEALYNLLEQQVVPEFYSRDEHGIPTAWVACMRESMARLTPRFCANRTVRQYTESHYLQAPSAGRWSPGSAPWNSIGTKCVSATG
jgi:glucan phosphorylase